jgi:hypothetical protein
MPSNDLATHSFLQHRQRERHSVFTRRARNACRMSGTRSIFEEAVSISLLGGNNLRSNEPSGRGVPVVDVSTSSVSWWPGGICNCDTSLAET